jgi:hypothetical protein
MENVAFVLLGLLAFPENDKRMHFIAGAGAAEIGRQSGLSPLQNCGVTLTLGLAKEAWDSTGRGHVEARDILATAAGCSITIRF